MRHWSLIVLAALWACGDGAASKPVDAGAPAEDARVDAGPQVNLPARMSLAELQNPETCKGCHPKQYAEWASSMHAYAATDPVFIAMNKKGQRETQGELKDFCVKCHAPMAVRSGLTTDGLNLAELPKPMQGVTCYFCHNATGTGSEHFNANVTLADDDIMRGSIRDAVNPGVHGVAYSESHDGRSMKASLLCGSCHDVVNDKGVHIERTLDEYKNSIHSIERSGKSGGDSCQGCHMPWMETGPVAEVQALGLQVPARDRHDHRWPAVDVALTDFPDREAHRKATECALSQDGAYIFEVINDGQGGFSVSIETTAGHAQPSGVAQDRRLWLEVVAYDGQDNVLWSSGKIGDTELEQYPISDPRHDPQLCMFRDHFEDETGKEVHMFWEAAKKRENESRLLPIAVNFGANHLATCSYRSPGRVQPARVTMRMRMRPVGIDVLQSLIDSGDLDPAVVQQMPTFTLHNTSIEWTAKDGGALYRPSAKPWPIECP
jgi:hypothetical protein